MNDTYASWVLDCLGLWGGGTYLDELEAAFNVTLYPSDNETIEAIEVAINCKYPNLGNIFAEQIYREVIRKAVEYLDAQEDDFEYQCNGTQDTYLMCKGELVTDWEDIVVIYDKDKE